MKTGQGKLCWADNSSYEGGFKDNAMHGEGVYTWEDGRQFRGTYLNNIMEG